MQASIDKEIQKSEEGLEFLISQHRCLYDATHGEGGTGLCVQLSVSFILRCIFRYQLSFKDERCMNDVKELLTSSKHSGRIQADMTSQSYKRRMNVNPNQMYAEVEPSKFSRVEG